MENNHKFIFLKGIIFIQAHTLSHNPSLHFGNFLIIIEKKIEYIQDAIYNSCNETG